MVWHTVIIQQTLASNIINSQLLAMIIPIFKGSEFKLLSQATQ